MVYVEKDTVLGPYAIFKNGIL